MILFQLILTFSLLLTGEAFQGPSQSLRLKTTAFVSTGTDDLSTILSSRFPTSIQDQVRQASEALKRATADGVHRHSVRLLLPLIGANDLDDWPGGTRQMIEAAFPLMEDVLGNLGAEKISQSIIDESDGIRLMMAQATEAKDDSCTVLLPSADTIQQLESIDGQVGESRNLMLVNAQWRRRSDFGFFGRQKQVSYAETFVPTFHCSNLMFDGEQVRVLRSYPGPWRVYVREEGRASVGWTEIGQKDFVASKPVDWENQDANKKNGGRLFDYGQPTYQEIGEMIVGRDGYQPKTVTERAAAAFTFNKDAM